jgi:four helix bundle protein
LRIAECGAAIGRRAKLATRNLNPKIQNFEMKKDLETRTKRFALSIIQLVGKLPRNKVSDVVGNQLLKSGTSIGANYREAGRARSRDDFIHKIAICEKEAAETEYWLELAQDANLVALTASEELLREVQELLAIFVASGRTAKSRR